MLWAWCCSGTWVLIWSLSNTLKDKSPLFYRHRNWGASRLASCSQGDFLHWNTVLKAVGLLCIMFYPSMTFWCALNCVFLTKSRPYGLTHLTRDIPGRLGCTVTKWKSLPETCSPLLVLGVSASIASSVKGVKRMRRSLPVFFRWNWVPKVGCKQWLQVEGLAMAQWSCMWLWPNQKKKKKKSLGLNSRDWGRHFQQMGLSVYIRSPWIPSLLAFRKECKVPSAQAGLFQLGSQICEYITVNGQVCTLFENCCLNKGTFLLLLSQWDHDRAIKITKDYWVQDSVCALFVSLLVNKPCTQESTMLLLRWACITKDHTGLFNTKAFPKARLSWTPSFCCFLIAQSLPCPPFSLCLLHLLLVLSYALYQNVSFFFFRNPKPCFLYTGR